MGAHSGKALSQEELQTVAELYKDANRRGISTQRHIANEMGVARSTAAKRIMASRKANFLPSVDSWYAHGHTNPKCIFTISDKDLYQLNRIAKAKGVTRSFAIREAVRLYVEANSQD
jgi:hypothetical protein